MCDVGLHDHDQVVKAGTGDRYRAEDLPRTALARTWPKWSKTADGHPEACAPGDRQRARSSWFVHSLVGAQDQTKAASTYGSYRNE